MIVRTGESKSVLVCLVDFILIGFRFIIKRIDLGIDLDN